MRSLLDDPLQNLRKVRIFVKKKTEKNIEREEGREEIGKIRSSDA